MARIAAAVAAAKKANVAEPVDQKPAIAKVPKKRGAKPMNQNAKNDRCAMSGGVPGGCYL